MIALRLIGLLALVSVNGFFAAVEFSLVAIRMSRVRQLVEAGDSRGRVVMELLKRLDLVVSGVQVGITLTSLGLGALGEATLATMLHPLVAAFSGRHTVMLVHGFSLTVAFLLLTILHVVLGELVPKSISLQRAERVALLVARPFQWYLGAFRPAIAILDAAGRGVLRGLGFSERQSHTQVHSSEELQIQIQQARERSLISPVEEKLIVGAIEMNRLRARELMIPRPDVHFVYADAKLDDVMRVLVTTQRSRLPVFEDSGDHVLGYIHIKDIVWVLLDRDRRSEEGWSAPEFNLRRMLHEVLIVPETKPATEVLAELRTRRSGMAMVVDEFGSIRGLITLEDVIEQFVGEIYDEYDVVQKPLIVGHGADAAIIFDAALGLHDLEAHYGIALPEDPAYATVGGFVLAELGFIPRGGESFDFKTYRFTVVEMDRRRIARVKIQRLKPLEPPPSVAAVPEAKPQAEANSGENHVTENARKAE